ncbi:MAG: transporter substrate-binding domain-containing protein [Coriobacteriia bacterium]|nr:transporter substrate-binding domain-containing protein [Coriobacteriia bacterium]
MSKRTQPVTSISKRALALLLMAILILFGLSGCLNYGDKEITLEPKLSTPTIITSGVLTVGVDSSRAPYAGVSRAGAIVGIDVDIAAALADILGLKLRIVDTADQDADEMLHNGEIDMVMDVEQSGAFLTNATEIGPYINSGPALFMEVKGTSLPTIDFRTLTGTKIVAQQDSLSAWVVDELLGDGTAVPVANLDAVLGAITNGTATYAAADAIIGSYLAADPGSISCVAFFPDAEAGVYIGVEKTNTVLVEALKDALTEIRNKGQLSVILIKWLGPLSSLIVINNQPIITQDAGTINSRPGEIDMGDDLPDPSLAGSPPVT